MKEKKLTKEEVKLLNTKFGQYALLSNKKINLRQTLEQATYISELKEKQEQLIKMQQWVIENNKKVVILFEGRDAAGKGGAIRRITEHINPRHYSIIALNKPTDDERQQWFFQRYVNELPNPGQMVFFDRSWYNRAVVEPVNKFCTETEYQNFMDHVNDFEKMLIKSDTFLIKLYFSITKTEQAKRFEDIQNSPLKRWKMTSVDAKAQELWDDYTHYKEKMFERTNTDLAPWKIIDANKKSAARLAAISHILNTIPYKK
jgi:polyphosphate kinase 2